jgi:ribosomal protein S18 acetylase RimI-like enzyme
MKEQGQLTMQPASTADVDLLMGWFDDESQFRRWGGPSGRYPYDRAQFLSDIRWDEIPSIAALDAAGHFVAFGQYYVKYGRCHLARLAVTPARRGQHIGRRFIGALLPMAIADTGLAEASLYVLGDNVAAMRCYRSLGFEVQPDPGPPIVENCLYMVRPRRDI